MIQARFDQTFAGWREEARRLLRQGVLPDDVSWSENELLLTPSFVEPSTPAAPWKETSRKNPAVPARFIELAETVSCARVEDRWSLLYRILYRLQVEGPTLLEISVDPDILRATHLEKSVRRDIHKMHAFVRFKTSPVGGVEHYVAWHKPEHLIVRAAAPFFERRFGDRRWSIFTPDESAHWDLESLSFGPGLSQHEFGVKDEWDEIWKTYYKSIFNPSRIKIKAMKQEMATKYWSSLPEAALIQELVREAPNRLRSMAENKFKAARVDDHSNLEELRVKALACRSCPLHANATQTVFGIGPKDAAIMIVGEQPGDQEDVAGRPFIGPAGEVLNQALHAAGLRRDGIYMTNAVKHFKWKRAGKTRLHQKPSGAEMHACKPWLEAEIALVRPRVIVALGVTAATAVLGRQPKISEERGRPMTGLRAAPHVLVSWHPSAILRASSPEAAAKMREELESDLRLGAELAREKSALAPTES